MNIFGNCTCSGCELETRFLLELKGEEDTFLLLGDTLENEEAIAGVIECDYCQYRFQMHVITVDGILSAFLNDEQYDRLEKQEQVVLKATKNQGLQKEYAQDLVQFHHTFYTPFAEQPFNPSEKLQLDGQAWTIQRIYKKEGVERDITRRLLKPTLDEYWYELENEENKRKWCVVTDISQDMFTFNLKGASSVSEAIQNAENQEDFFEFVVPTKTNKEERDHNAILLIDPPFLSENETSHDVTDSLFQTTCMFEHQISHNIYVKAYEYLSGVRYYVYNSGGELEMDVFGETAEDALNQVQDQYSISTDEQ